MWRVWRAFFSPHYHAIVFGLDSVRSQKLIEDSWSMGFISVGSVTSDSANYVARYTVKGGLTDEECFKLGLQPQFLVMSRRPGIGSNLATSKEYQTWLANSGFCVHKGLKYPIPRYYKTKLEPQLLDKLRKKVVDYICSLTADKINLPNKNYHKYVEPDVNEHERLEQLWKNTCSKLSLKKGKL